MMKIEKKKLIIINEKKRIKIKNKKLMRKEKIYVSKLKFE